MLGAPILFPSFLSHLLIFPLSKHKINVCVCSHNTSQCCTCNREIIFNHNKKICIDSESKAIAEATIDHWLGVKHQGLCPHCRDCRVVLKSPFPTDVQTLCNQNSQNEFLLSARRCRVQRAKLSWFKNEAKQLKSTLSDAVLLCVINLWTFCWHRYIYE